jgi:hypothetical protein
MEGLEATVGLARTSSNAEAMGGDAPQWPLAENALLVEQTWLTKRTTGSATHQRARARRLRV